MCWFGELLTKHPADSRIVVQRDAEHGTFAQHVERCGGGDGAQVVKTLFVIRAAEPVNRIAAVLTFALEVVNLHARDLIAGRIAQQEDREITCFNRDSGRIRADEDGRIAHRVDRAIEIMNIGIDGNAGTHVESVRRPVRCFLTASA